MEAISKLSVEGSTHHNGYIIQFQTDKGLRQFLLPAEGVAHLLKTLLPVAQAAPSYALQMAVAPLTIETIAVGTLHGQPTVTASLQAGISMVSTISRADLERISREINTVLAVPLQQH